jgi:hypothetical protein
VSVSEFIDKIAVSKLFSTKEMNERMMFCLPAKARMHENIVGRSNIFRHSYAERDRSPLPARFLEERTDWG